MQTLLDDAPHERPLTGRHLPEADRAQTAPIISIVRHGGSGGFREVARDRGTTGMASSAEIARLHLDRVQMEVWNVNVPWPNGPRRQAAWIRRRRAVVKLVAPTMR